jgi:hypothetical protein
MKRGLLLLGGLLAIVISSCKRATPPPKSWYDAAPLLESLRPEERAEAGRAAGGGNLSDLPLYELSLELSPDLRRFKLVEELHFTNTYGEPLEEVVLRIYANAVGNNPPVKFERGACEDGVKCTLSQPSPSAIAVKPPAPLARGERLRIRLELSAELPQIEPSRTTMLAQSMESLARLGGDGGAGDYGLLAESDGVASLANFYAVLARRRDGRWEIGEASTLGDLGADGISHVRLRARCPKGVKLVSSGVTTREEAADSGREVHVVAALVRDFALLASSRFEIASRKVGNVDVRSHYLAEDEPSGKRVLDGAAQALAVFERRFGRYPYADLDVVEAPLVGGAGGVEFSGLVTIASMLYRPMFSEGPLGMLGSLLGGGKKGEIDTISAAMLEFVVAHEVAHQYWPGLVGSDSRTHPFADEALAQYSAVLYFEDRYGAERAELEADRQVLANYQMMRLLGTADGKVDRPVGEFPSELAYAGLVYGKAPFFFRELRKTAGDTAFFGALGEHVAEHRFKHAPARALVDRLARGDKAAAVRALEKRWLEEAHGDADLGEPDLRKVLAAYIGADAARELGPELDVVGRLLLKLLNPGAQGSGQAPSLLDLLKGP